MRTLPACFTICRLGELWFAVSPSDRTLTRTFERQPIDIRDLRVIVDDDILTAPSDKPLRIP